MSDEEIESKVHDAVIEEIQTRTIGKNDWVSILRY